MNRKAEQPAPRSRPVGADHRGPVIVLTCEHGGNHIPAAYRHLFSSADDVLKSHRGWDPGALRVAQAMSEMLGATLFSETTSRLLVELNRSLGHRSLFSEFTAALPAAEKQLIIDKHWQPWRDEVTAHIDNLFHAGRRVIHLSIHSFTPLWEGSRRKTNIGLLYDPRRPEERSLCETWKTDLKQERPDFTIHNNQPYRGIGDGFTKWLRRRFDATARFSGSYIGVEVEINHALIHPTTTGQIQSIAAMLCQWPSEIRRKAVR
ncbi:MAG: N-formylglutamate amidohydrolase [Planctomycetaceae bacterium]